MMEFTVLTIFPEMVAAFWEHGIIRRAIERKKIFASALNIRDFATDRHQVTDDRPYGGGSGMIMKPEPLAGAIAAAEKTMPAARKILLTPRGRVFNQSVAWELAACEGLILVCGRYEGIDERICHGLIEDEISIGDYILSGGELAAMVIIEAVTRLIPGALGADDAVENDSFSNGLLEYAHYTRPPVFEDQHVPEVLLSGHHRKIENWRLESSLMRTLLKRPELLHGRELNNREREILEKWSDEIQRILESYQRSKKRGGCE
jgi:tRNA (guanine37-N1)-methyltransferase